MRAECDMIAFFAIIFNAILRMLTARDGPGSQLEAMSCPRKHVKVPCRLTKAVPASGLCRLLPATLERSAVRVVGAV